MPPGLRTRRQACCTGAAFAGALEAHLRAAKAGPREAPERVVGAVVQCLHTLFGTTASGGLGGAGGQPDTAVPRAALLLLRLLDGIGENADALGKHAPDLRAVVDRHGEQFGWSLLEGLLEALRGLQAGATEAGAGRDAILPVRKVLEVIERLCEGLGSKQGSRKKAADQARAFMAENFLPEVLALLLEGNPSKDPPLMRDAVHVARQLLLAQPKGPARDTALAKHATKLKCLTNSVFLACGDVPTMAALASFAHAFLLRSRVPEVRRGAFTHASTRGLRDALLRLPSGKTLSERSFLEAVVSDEAVLREAQVNAPVVLGISVQSRQMRKEPWFADLVGAKPRLFYGKRHISFEVRDDMDDDSAEPGAGCMAADFIDIPTSKVAGGRFSAKGPAPGARVTLSLLKFHFPDSLNVPGDEGMELTVEPQDPTAGDKLMAWLQEDPGAEQPLHVEQTQRGAETALTTPTGPDGGPEDDIRGHAPAAPVKSSRGKRYSRIQLQVSSADTEDFELKSVLKVPAMPSLSLEEPESERGASEDAMKPQTDAVCAGLDESHTDMDSGGDCGEDDFVLRPSVTKPRKAPPPKLRKVPSPKPREVPALKPRKVTTPKLKPQPQLQQVLTPKAKAKAVQTAKVTAKGERLPRKLSPRPGKRPRASWKLSPTRERPNSRKSPKVTNVLGRDQTYTRTVAAAVAEAAAEAAVVTLPHENRASRLKVQGLSLSHQLVVQEVSTMVEDAPDDSEAEVPYGGLGLKLPHLFKEGRPSSTPKTPLSSGLATAAVREEAALKVFQGTVNAAQAFCNEVLMERQAILAQVGTNVQRTMARHKREMAAHCEEFESALLECDTAEREMHVHFKSLMAEAQQRLWNEQRQKMAAVTSWGESAMKVTRTLQAKPESVKLLQWIND